MDPTALFDATTEGHHQHVQQLMIGQSVGNIETAVGMAARYGHIECLKLLAQADDQYDERVYGWALIEASDHGHTQCVAFLMTLVDPKYNQCMALDCAAAQGHIDCVKLLLPVSDTKSNEHTIGALALAALHGHTEIVKFLIPHSNPKAGGSRALIEAASKSKTQCVELLLPVSDPTDNNRVLIKAVESFYLDPTEALKCIKLLIPVSDCNNDIQKALRICVYQKLDKLVPTLIAECDYKKALNYVQKYDDPIHARRLELYIAQYEHALITKNISVNKHSSQKKKI